MMDYWEVMGTLTGIMEEYPEETEERYALEIAITLVKKALAEDDGR